MSVDLNNGDMSEKIIAYIYRVLCLTMLIAALAACSDVHGDGFVHSGNNGGSRDEHRVVTDETRKVLLLYSAGYNSLSSFLKEDIADLRSGYLPGQKRNDDIMLVYSHTTSKSGNYSVRTSPVLMRLSSGFDGSVVTDTLVVYPEETVSSSAGQLNEVLSYIRDEFPARSYGMVFSSHATGYLPSGYYTNSNDYETSASSVRMLSSPYGNLHPVPYVAPDYDPSLPLTKSIGQDQWSVSGARVSYEMELADFAEAIPMKMDYILFDACLMGGVEVAYQLRDVCGKVGFSQAEVLAEGLDYKTLTKHLLQEETPQPEKVCEDYFLQYDSQSGVHRSATISIVDCGKMESLISICGQLFAKYYDKIHALSPESVQRFYRSNYHWFYDLESILVQAGVTSEELKSLHDALDKCVLYKASTPSFMNEFNIEVFSGFSMFLPSNGGGRLKEYYRTLDWNKATGLVK